MRRATASLPIVVGLVLAVLLSACSKSDPPAATPAPAPPGTAGDQNWVAISSATKALGTLQTKGTIAAVGGSAEGPLEGRFTGTTAAVTMPVFKDDKAYPVELRWNERGFWVRRAVPETAPAPTQAPGVPPTVFPAGGLISSVAMFRSADQPEWASAGDLARSVAVGYVDPFRALDTAATLGLTPVGTEPHDGDTWTRYRQEPPTEGTQVIQTGMLAGTLELWVDAQQVLRKVRYANPERIIDYEVSGSSDPLAVEAPTADQLGQTGGTTSVPVPIDRVGGEWATKQQGTSANTTWVLEQAPSVTGGLCYRLTLKPAVGGSYTGRSNCADPVDETTLTQDQLQVVAVDAADAPVNGVVAVLTPGFAATDVGFADRSTVPLTKAGDLAIWVGPPTPQAVWVAASAPDGKLGCGSGVITSLGDLDRIDPSQITAYRDSGWTCVAAG